MAKDMGCCKYLMFFFNLLIFLGGVALLSVGIWVTISADSFRNIISSDPTIFNAVYIIIAVGALLFLVGFLGCCGAIKENKCLLASFFTLVLIIFIVEIAGGILAFVYYPTAKQVALDSMKFYGDGTEAGTTIKAGWDAVQETFHCCGINSGADWLNAGAEVISQNPCPNLLWDPVGCEDALKNYFVILGGIACGVLVVELLAMIFACCIYQNVRKGRYA